jgi:malonate-semialdehyde dehydrogenase (acetylating) / methylmalonate-semialdehyde dehydrogenase
MTASQSIVPLLIGERPIVPNTSNFNEVFNPSKAEAIALPPMCGLKEVDLAVQVAAKAYRDWSTTPATKRSAILFRFKQLLEQELQSLNRLITLENGKTYAEAKGDVRRGIEVVDFACGIAQLTKGENLPRIAGNLDSETMRKPIGVFAGITPFNFTALLCICPRRRPSSLNVAKRSDVTQRYDRCFCYRLTLWVPSSGCSSRPSSCSDYGSHEIKSDLLR